MNRFPDRDSLGPNARLAWDTLNMKPVRGIPSWMLHVMDIGLLEQESGRAPGTYRADPDGAYLDFQRNAGTCLIDQYLARNPLSMGEHGYESETERSATTGAECIVVDGMAIRGPDDVADHLEQVEFPRLRKAIDALDPDANDAVAALIEGEIRMQERFGPDILKVPYGGGFQSFPGFRYGQYGYAHYFMAYALYPEIMEQDFALQADLAVRHNRRAARAYVEGGLPRVLRLDHDMTDSRGPLASPRSLEALWYPHFARSLEPYHEAGIRLLWHCDGNIMPMVPMLLRAGIGGFQGFQYEDDVDYPAICRMTDRNGGPLLIWAGVSVTRTLPLGTVRDVTDELHWLVQNGPPVGLFLAASSSIVPGARHDNIRALMEGLARYRQHGRQA